MAAHEYLEDLFSLLPAVGSCDDNNSGIRHTDS